MKTKCEITCFRLGLVKDFKNFVAIYSKLDQFRLYKLYFYYFFNFSGLILEDLNQVKQILTPNNNLLTIANMKEGFDFLDRQTGAG